MLALNLGCGSNKIKGCVNVDIEESCKPDIITDFRTYIPFSDNSVDRIYFFHVVEHIEKSVHPRMFMEFHRILKSDGFLFVSYPEFTKIAQNYIENKRGKREFWEATIYGRQLYKSDYHVSLMDTQFFKVFLEQHGFVNVESKPEPIPNEFNTVVKCQKGQQSKNYEDILNDEIFSASALR